MAVLLWVWRVVIASYAWQGQVLALGHASAHAARWGFGHAWQYGLGLGGSQAPLQGLLLLQVPCALHGGAHVGGVAVGVDEGPVRQQNAGQGQAARWVLVHGVAPVRGREKATSVGGLVWLVLQLRKVASSAASSKLGA
jgi:hypothetical protein